MQLYSDQQIFMVKKIDFSSITHISGGEVFSGYLCGIEGRKLLNNLCMLVMLPKESLTPSRILNRLAKHMILSGNPSEDNPI